MTEITRVHLRLYRFTDIVIPIYQVYPAVKGVRSTRTLIITDDMSRTTRTLLDAKGNAHYSEDALGNGT